jgi:hypothetical protein
MSPMKKIQPVVHYSKTHTVITCPLGHLIAACAHGSFAGSRFAAEAVAVQRGERSIWDDEAKACDGFGHTEVA